MVRLNKLPNHLIAQACPHINTELLRRPLHPVPMCRVTFLIAAARFAPSRKANKHRLRWLTRQFGTRGQLKSISVALMRDFLYFSFKLGLLK